MNQPLIIVAKIKAAKDKENLVKKELLKLVEPTRNEAGCIQYDLHQDNQSPDLFLLYEQWETKELWLKHRVNDHMTRFRKIAEEAVDDFLVNEMTVIS